MEDLDVARVIAIVSLFLAPLILGLLPVIITRKFKLRVSEREMSQRTMNVLSGLLCFGGGVLMATAFIHLLPELHDGMEKQGLNETVPMAELVCCLGFFLIYFVEEVVHIISERSSKSKKRHSHSSHTGSEVSEGSEGPSPSESLDAKTPDAAGGDPEEKAGHGHSHSHPPMTPSLEGFIIVMGLSIHSIFEGMAIGLGDSASDVWKLLAAVASHKLVISFCIGLEMSVTGISLAMHSCYMLVFCIATPLGIGIGWIFASDDDTEQKVALILQALSAGTMIYVAFFEVIARERTKPANKLLQLAAIFLGYAVMFGLDTLLEDGD